MCPTIFRLGDEFYLCFMYCIYKYITKTCNKQGTVSKIVLEIIARVNGRQKLIFLQFGSIICFSGGCKRVMF